MASNIILILLVFYPFFVLSQTTNFTFHGFNESEASFILDEALIIKPSGLLRLTNRSNNVIGHAFYSKPIQMFDKNSLAYPNASSFSTSFYFAIVQPSSTKGGFGLAFTLSPSPSFPGAQAEHFLGIFNQSNDGNPTNHIFAVEFDTVNGHNENSDSQGNHVGININSMFSNASEPASYYVNNTKHKEEMELETGDPVHAWIEYDGVRKLVNVTIAPPGQTKPTTPLISHPVDLTPIVKDTMYVGFSASTGAKSSFHYVLGWSFSLNGIASPLNISQLPIPPKEPNGSSFSPEIVALIAVLSGVFLVLMGLLVFWFVRKRMFLSENLEDWELDCPHRFRYKDLYFATKRFKESEVIGIGGFGEVYKGVLPTTGGEVAVKKIARNSVQGMREFAAEIESLGRLRHKHLVNLQGWCKQKNNLLLVYDYVPNGSLDSLLFNPKDNIVLSWEQRLNIIKGIASGLLYLHEEWEQVVIHRDVKSSNVLIDSDMNARLGDFGLARLYDHGNMSHTTNVVGTIGYIAPEFARTGKASASSDVFAFGVLLLEVATGRRPIDSDQFILVDWVIEFQQMGQILNAADPKLNSNYDVEEIELVLELGLVCSHHRPELRPNMRQVVKYLNGDEPLPMFENWSCTDSQRTSEMNSRYLGLITSDIVTSSYYSSSIGGVSSTSMDAGR